MSDPLDKSFDEVHRGFVELQKSLVDARLAMEALLEALQKLSETPEDEG